MRKCPPKIGFPHVCVPQFLITAEIDRRGGFNDVGCLGSSGVHQCIRLLNSVITGIQVGTKHARFAIIRIGRCFVGADYRCLRAGSSQAALRRHISVHGHHCVIYSGRTGEISSHTRLVRINCQVIKDTVASV